MSPPPSHFKAATKKVIIMTNLALNLEPAETSLTFVQNGQVLTDSRTVAATFGKQHKDVLRRIAALECPADFSERNFAPAEYTDEQGKPRICYHITRDGFVLLVMGFTGKKAMAFKIKYIEAFNAMERALSAQPALDAKAIGGIVKKCAAKAVKDEIAALPAPSFNPQALVEALEKARREEEGHRCIGMAVSPQEKRRTGRDRTVKRITARKPP